jgi:UDP-N-acetylmuramyl pentapeptide phosphotransferase/UDP-N-acetylglucosamine-1-phosphate transferase
MFGDFDKYIMVFLTGLLASYLLTPVVKSMAFRFGVIDLPNERRPHQRPTARGGGVALFIAAQFACLLAVTFPWHNKLAGEFDFSWWWRFALASSILFAVGIIDDVRGMKPWIKLAGQTLAALVVSLSGTKFGLFLGYNLPPLVDHLLVVIWLVAIINAFNLIDGLDGLASGLAVISAVGLCGILAMQHKAGDVLVLVGFIGACLGFLRYNFHPASIFLGDTGSMFIGFTLGVISLQTLNKNSFIISFTIPMLVLGVPIYDAVLAIWRRTVRKWISEKTHGVKRGIMQPDLEHLHHRLKFGGLSTQRVAMYLYIINGTLVIVGLLIALFQSQAAGIFLIALLAGVYVIMRHLAVIELRETGSALLMGLRRPTNSAIKSLFYPFWDMIWLSGSLAIIIWVVEPTKRVDFWHNWFFDLPVWVTPTFSLLAISRNYVTYWPRARLRDIISVIFLLLGGILFSLALALLVDPAESQESIIRAFWVIAISHPPIIASRVIYRCMEELAIWVRGQSEHPGAAERILLYGAGTRAQLFLKDCAASNAKTPDRRLIVGFIDDESALHYQWTYGYLVLGGTKELAHLISKWRINRIIVVADLLPENWQVIRDIAVQQGVHLSEWFPQEHEINLVKSKKSDIVETLNKNA